MDFILNTEESGLSPEKLDGTYYNSSIGEFVIHFYTMNEITRFARLYDCKLLIEASNEDYELPTLTLLVND